MSSYDLLIGKIKSGNRPSSKSRGEDIEFSIMCEGVKITVVEHHMFFSRDDWRYIYSVFLDGEDVSKAFTKSELEGIASEMKKVYNNHIKAEADKFIKSKFNQEIETISPTIPKSYWKYGDWSK